MSVGSSVKHDLPEMIYQCPSCRQLLNEHPQYNFDPTFDPIFHAMSCRAMSNIRTNRHDQVVTKLNETLRDLFGYNASKTEQVINHITQERCDVLLTVNSRRYCLDVSIVNAASATNVTRNHSHVSALAATKVMEKIKLEKYRKAIPIAERNATHIIPFVIEASGRLGHEATKFIETTLEGSFCKDPAKIEKWMDGLDYMRAAIHRGNSVCIEYYKRNYHTIPVESPSTQEELEDPIT